MATLPQTVSVVLLLISKMLERGFNRTSGRSPLQGGSQAFRTDAKCEANRIVFGGWELTNGADPKQARWFALEVSPEEVPWLFDTEHLPSRSTVAELLASLIALEVFGHFEAGARPRQVVLEAGTDNLAKEHITRKGASNKFPLFYVQMQLGLKCYLHGLVFQLRWRPRETNVEADDLTNLRFDRFTMALRCQVNWKGLDWSMMEELLQFREEVQRWREEKRKLPGVQVKASKRQKTAAKTKW